MLPEVPSDTDSYEWLLDKNAVTEAAMRLREQMDTDFTSFLSTISHCREISKLKGARFAEGAFARLAAEGLRMQGLYGPGIEAAEQAKTLLTHFPKDREYVLSIRTLAACYAVSGNIDLGLKTYLDGVETARTLEFGRDTLVLAFDLCHWNREVSDFEQALSYLRYVSDHLLEFCNEGLENILYSNYGEVYMEMGLVQDAEHILKKGLQIGNPEFEQYYLYLHGAMACVRAAQERHQEAAELLKLAQDISSKFADTRITAWLGFRLGKTYISYRQPERSIPLLRESIELCESYQDDWLLVDLYKWLTTAHRNMGDIEAAFNSLNTGHNILQYAHRQKMSRESAQLEKLNYNWRSRESELQSEISDALVKGKEAAERANQFQSLFLTKMSHELRTPLNGVLGVTRMLLNRNLNAEERQLAQTIYNSGQHILKLVNGVLDLSKLEAGTLPLEVQSFDLKRLIDETVELYSPLCEEKGIVLRANLSMDLELQVRGDKTHITQVITNLIGNAIKFTTFGEIHLRVERCSSNTEPQKVRFTVKDSGIGLSPEDLDAIFEVFGQSAKSKFTGGAGLGLSISRELVALMGGTIYVRSEVGKGSEFSFEIPLLYSGLNQSTTVTGNLTDSHASLTGVKVLVAEDDDINWMVLQSMLVSLRASAVRTSNGKEAVELFNGGVFELIILDCHMDVMDGFEAAEAIRSHETKGRIPILALSADVLEANQARCIASGMDGFLGKPIQASELLAKVAEVAPNLVVSH